MMPALLPPADANMLERRDVRQLSTQGAAAPGRVARAGTRRGPPARSDVAAGQLRPPNRDAGLVLRTHLEARRDRARAGERRRRDAADDGAAVMLVACANVAGLLDQPRTGPRPRDCGAAGHGRWTVAAGAPADHRDAAASPPPAAPPASRSPTPASACCRRATSSRTSACAWTSSSIAGSSPSRSPWPRQHPSRRPHPGVALGAVGRSVGHAAQRRRDRRPPRAALGPARAGGGPGGARARARHGGRVPLSRVRRGASARPGLPHRPPAAREHQSGARPIRRRARRPVLRPAEGAGPWHPWCDRGDAVVVRAAQPGQSRRAAASCPKVSSSRRASTTSSCWSPGWTRTISTPCGCRWSPGADSCARIHRTRRVSPSSTRRWPPSTGRGRRRWARRLRLRDGTWAQVVGIAADSKYNFITEAPTPFVFLATRQNPALRTTLLVATPGDSAALAAPVRGGGRVARSRRARSPAPGRWSAFTPGTRCACRGSSRASSAPWASVGLGLAMVGLYGLVAYAVSRRTREIGIRMAIGAQPGSVLGMVMRHGLLLAGGGAVAGIADVRRCSGVLRAMFPVEPGHRPRALRAGRASASGVTLVAALVPARRAARIDPLAALREE